MCTLPQFVPDHIFSGCWVVARARSVALQVCRIQLPPAPMMMGFNFSELSGQTRSGPATETATEAQTQKSYTAEEIGDDAEELNKALKSVTGLGESAAKARGKLFGGD